MHKDDDKRTVWNWLKPGIFWIFRKMIHEFGVQYEVLFIWKSIILCVGIFNKSQELNLEGTELLFIKIKVAEVVSHP